MRKETAYVMRIVGVLKQADNEASRPALAARPPGLRLALAPEIERAARMRSLKTVSSTLSPSWVSMARLAFPVEAGVE
jgi:hypothetical protein